MPRVSRSRIHLEPHPVSGPGGLAVVALRELWDPALSTGIRTVHRYSAWPGMPVFCDCQLPAIWAPRIEPPRPTHTHHPSGAVGNARGLGAGGASEVDSCGPMGCGPVGGAWEWRCRNAGRPGAGCQARDGPSLLSEWDDEGLSFGSLSDAASSSAAGSDDSDGEDNSDGEDDDESSSSDEFDDDF